VLRKFPKSYIAKVTRLTQCNTLDTTQFPYFLIPLTKRKDDLKEQTLVSAVPCMHRSGPIGYQIKEVCADPYKASA
jgi:hypothetical protein